MWRTPISVHLHQAARRGNWASFVLATPFPGHSVLTVVLKSHKEAPSRGKGADGKEMSHWTRRRTTDSSESKERKSQAVELYVNNSVYHCDVCDIMTAAR